MSDFSGCTDALRANAMFYFFSCTNGFSTGLSTGLSVAFPVSPDLPFPAIS